MEKAEVIIKGERHWCRADLAEEKEILVNGVDYLILEGTQKKDSYHGYQYLYWLPLFVFGRLFIGIVETDKSVLREIANSQDAATIPTRESNISVFENSHPTVLIASLGIFYSFFVCSIALGLLGYFLIEKIPFVVGVITLLAGTVLSMVLLRIHESRRKSRGRDEKTAGKITDAAQKGGRIVAVVGKEHTKHIPDYLPDRIEFDSRGANKSSIAEGCRTLFRVLKALIAICVFYTLIITILYIAIVLALAVL